MKLNYSVKGLFLCLLFPVIGFTQTQTADYFNVRSGGGKGLRFWNGNNNYRIAMGNGSEYKYGPVTDYSIKTFMNGTTGRGWTWGISGQTPIAALRNNGTFQIAKDFIAMGKIGVGTANPLEKIHLYGTLNSSTAPAIRFETLNTSNGEYYIQNIEGGFNQSIKIRVGKATSQNSDPTLETVAQFNELGVSIFQKNFEIIGGNLSLKADYANSLFSLNSTNFKVKTNGYVYARQMEIIGSGNFPDYVFDADYELRSLEEVENYIEEHHHLPDVPSAEEIKENGHNLGEMDEILLKKIEELTLYMIELKKENEELKGIVEELSAKKK